MKSIVTLRFCVSFIVLTAAAIGAPACLGQPATTSPVQTTQPSVAGERTEGAIIADFKQTIGKLHETMGDVEQLADPQARARIAPQAVPLLRRLVDDLDELVRIQPMAKSDAEGAREDFLVYLSLLGDPSGADRLKQMVDSTDPVESLRGLGGQLLARWLATAKDAGAQSKVADDAEQLAKAHPASEELTGQLMAMSRLGAASAATADRMESLVTTVMKNPVADTIGAQLTEMRKLKVLEGQPLEIKGKLLDGGDFSTAQWKGKVVVVDFWATWCGPCIAQLPRLTKTYADYHTAGLEVLGVSNDFSADNLKGFLAENKNVSWPQLFDPSAAEQQQYHPVARSLGIHVIPMTLLIDKKGIVRSTNGARGMNDLLPKLLAE